MKSLRKSIMKTGVLTCLFMFMFNGVFSQAFDDGTNLVTIGFGLPPAKNITQDFDTKTHFTDYHLKNFGTIILKYERGLHKYFGLGLNLEYSGSSVNYKYGILNSDSLKYQIAIKSNVFGAFVRLNGHLPVGEKLDFYAGVGLGYKLTLYNYMDTNPNTAQDVQHKSSNFDFAFQGTVGARYMVKESVGLFIEAGFATTICQLGVVMKF